MSDRKKSRYILWCNRSSYGFGWCFRRKRKLILKKTSIKLPLYWVVNLQLLGSAYQSFVKRNSLKP